MDMLIMDALDSARAMNMFLINMKQSILDNLSSIDKDKCDVETLKIWALHYMEGVTSYESFANVVKSIGAERILKRKENELEVSEDMKLTIKEMK